MFIQRFPKTLKHLTQVKVAYSLQFTNQIVHRGYHGNSFCKPAKSQLSVQWSKMMDKVKALPPAKTMNRSIVSKSFISVIWNLQSNIADFD